MLNGRAFWTALLVLFIAMPVFAQDVASPSREEVQQKMQMVKMLLANSPVLERAARSGNAPVKQPAEVARTLYSRASDAFAENNLVWASAFLDEAISLMEDAARLAEDPDQVETGERARYAELLDDVRAFQATYQDARKGIPAKDAREYDQQVDSTRTMVERAQAMVRDGRYKEACGQLEEVHGIYISALNKLYGSTALVYDAKFKSAPEEFAYELARYRGYEELLPIARVQLHPDPGTLQLSERYVQESRAGLDNAQKQAAGGDHQAAIITLQGATKRLQTALRTIGLETPE